MEKLFVPYAIAKLLKKRGFDEECLGWYQIVKPNDIDIPIERNGRLHISQVKNNNLSSGVVAPTHQQAVDFLLEKHNLDIHAHKMWHYSYNYEEKRMETFYQVSVCDFTIDREARDAHGDRIYQKYISSTLLKTYKEAIEDGITWALKHIK